MSYVRVGIQGSAVGGEVWSVNYVIDPTLEFGTTVSQPALDAAAAAIAALNPGLSSLGLMSTLLTINSCRLEVRDDVTDALIGLSVQGRAVPLPGTLAPQCPYQAAVVVSLRTNTPGGSGRGRIYWPAAGSRLNSSARMAVVDRDQFAGEQVTYVHAMESALATAFPTIGFDLAVRSKTTRTTPHVTRIQVGDVVDTQRRRRDKLAESYVSVNV